jgi:hypothetical protein
MTPRARRRLPSVAADGTGIELLSAMFDTHREIFHQSG